MKKKVLKNLHFAFMAVLTALPLGSVAQSAIYSFNYMESEFAIIRSYKDNVDIRIDDFVCKRDFIIWGARIIAPLFLPFSPFVLYYN